VSFYCWAYAVSFTYRAGPSFCPYSPKFGEKGLFSEVAPDVVTLNTRLRCLKHGGAYESAIWGRGSRCLQKQEITPLTS
jgi:hypothetical protein